MDGEGEDEKLILRQFFSAPKNMVFLAFEVPKCMITTLSQLTDQFMHLCTCPFHSKPELF